MFPIHGNRISLCDVVHGHGRRRALKQRNVFHNIVNRVGDSALRVLPYQCFSILGQR